MHKCTVCDKDFKSTYYLNNHQETIHLGKKFQCSECDKQFSENKTLKVHINSVHKGIKLECEACGKTFITSSGLRHHIQTVHNDIRYDCNVCKYQSTRLSPRLPWWILTYRSRYANIPKYCGNELILHSTYRFWNLFFIVESDDFIWKNTSFWFQICFCLKYFIFFYYENSIFKISP